MKKTLSAAFVVAALALTSACGGGDDKPSKEDLSKSFVKTGDGQITKKQADCLAEVILDSDISQEGLEALEKGDEDFKPSKADDKAQKDVADELAKCE